MNENYIDVCELPLFDSDLPQQAMSYCRNKSIKMRLLNPNCFSDVCIMQVADTTPKEEIEDLKQLFKAL